MLKVFIVEDDIEFCKEIAAVMSQIDSVKVEYLTSSGEDLLKAVSKTNPDICIIDIGLPDISGINVAEQVRKKYFDTDIIFITAYEDYISEAVKLYASDYIKKPLDQERLIQTIKRIKHKRKTFDRTMEVKTENQETVWIKEDDILFVEAFGKKIALNTEHGTFYSNQSLSEMESKLNNYMFYKTSRSYIVNLAKVKMIKPRSRTSFDIYFDTTEYRAVLSKKNYTEFRKKIKMLTGRGSH